MPLFLLVLSVDFFYVLHTIYKKLSQVKRELTASFAILASSNLTQYDILQIV